MTGAPGKRFLVEHRCRTGTHGRIDDCEVKSRVLNADVFGLQTENLEDDEIHRVMPAASALACSFFGSFFQDPSTRLNLACNIRLKLSNSRSP